MALAAFSAVFFWHGLYWIVTASLIYRERDDSGYARRYAWMFNTWPWFGYLPSAGVSFRHFRVVQLHLFFVGLLASSVLFVWLHPGTATSVAIVHLWWMSPRLFLLYAMRRLAKPGTIVTITPNDVGLYAP